MSEHKVRKNNIIYIIPSDELFIKWRNDEAFIDDYGRLMNRKPHRVLKELKHYVDDSIMEEDFSFSLKDLFIDKIGECAEAVIDRTVDIFFYEVLPSVWHKHVVPFFSEQKIFYFLKS